MSEQRPNPAPEPGENKPSYTPASPVKRALAWMGIVYMLILVPLTTYNMATGEPIRNIPGILLFPACGGLAAVCFLRGREIHNRLLLALGVLAAVACAFNLVTGVLSLAAALGG